MSKARNLESEFRTPKNTRGGILMLTAEEACRLIQRAEGERIRVLGIDSFILKEGSTQPIMEHSVDYSAGDFISDSEWQAATTFIEERASIGLHFEVVLGDASILKTMPHQTPEPTAPSGRGSS